MLKAPDSEILAKFFAEMGEKCGQKMKRNVSPHLRPSISRKEKRAQEISRRIGDKFGWL